MTAVYLTLAALVILGAVMVLTGRWDPGMVSADRPLPPPLPPGRWHAADVERLQFRVGLRGYRMEDVDAALAALATDLRHRDERGFSEATTPDPTGTPPAG